MSEESIEDNQDEENGFFDNRNTITLSLFFVLDLDLNYFVSELRVLQYDANLRAILDSSGRPSFNKTLILNENGTKMEYTLDRRLLSIQTTIDLLPDLFLDVKDIIIKIMTQSNIVWFEMTVNFYEQDLRVIEYLSDMVKIKKINEISKVFELGALHPYKVRLSNQDIPGQIEWFEISFSPNNTNPNNAVNGIIFRTADLEKTVAFIGNLLQMKDKLIRLIKGDSEE